MIKKVLWVCNTPLPEIQDMVGIKNYNEGWLVGISNQLRKQEGIELNYAFPQRLYPKLFHKKERGIKFWGFYDTHKTPYEINKRNISNFHDLIQKINPDIIHIFGTEFSHSLEFVNGTADKNKIIISIQGLTSEIEKVYLGGIPFIDRIVGTFVNGRYECLANDKYVFYKRGINERDLLMNVNHVIGRTKWDKKCIHNINPKCHYYFCNETLRDTFYEGKWDIKNIQRYSIFVSQGNYPIKGLHLLIHALFVIKKKFPGVVVYVAGDKSFLELGTPYGIYIRKIIKKYGVEENVVFLGKLTDDKMKERLLRSHVMVMPSLIENSPNSIGEAMLLGTPVIASNVGGIPSILKHGVEGCLYPSMDTKKLSKIIMKVFMDDLLALSFSRNAQKRAIVQYSKTNNGKRLLEIYSQVAMSN